MLDSPFNEDSINIIFYQGGPNFGGGAAGKFKEIGNNRNIVMQIGGWSVSKENTGLCPLYQNPCGASAFLHSRPNFRKTN